MGDRRVVYKSVCDHCVLQEGFYPSNFQSFVGYVLRVDGFLFTRAIGLSQDKGRWKELQDALSSVGRLLIKKVPVIAPSLVITPKLRYIHVSEPCVSFSSFTPLFSWKYENDLNRAVEAALIDIDYLTSIELYSFNFC